MKFEYQRRAVIEADEMLYIIEPVLYAKYKMDISALVGYLNAIACYSSFLDEVSQLNFDYFNYLKNDLEQEDRERYQMFAHLTAGVLAHAHYFKIKNIQKGDNKNE